MVNALDSGSRGPGSSPVRGLVLRQDTLLSQCLPGGKGGGGYFLI